MDKRVEETMIYPFGEFAFGIRIKYNYDGKPIISSDSTTPSTMPISTTPTIILPEELEDYSPLPKSQRVRTIFSRKQLKTLERKFQKNRYLTSEQRKELAERTELTEKQIQDWFRNHRTRGRVNCATRRQGAENTRQRAQNLHTESSSEDNDSDFLSSEEGEEESSILATQNAKDDIKVVSIVQETEEDEEVPLRVYGKGIHLASDEIPVVDYIEEELNPEDPVDCNESASLSMCVNEEITVSDIFDFLEGCSGYPLVFSETERKILAGSAGNEFPESKSEVTQPRQDMIEFPTQPLSETDEMSVALQINYSAAQIGHAFKREFKETPVAHIEPIPQLKWQSVDKQQTLITPEVAVIKKPKLEIIEQIIFCPKHLQKQSNCFAHLENVEPSLKNRTKVIWF